MKNNKFHLENLYISPRNKEADSTRNIYMKSGALSKTARNNNTSSNPNLRINLKLAQQSQNKKLMLKDLNLKQKLSKMHDKTNISHDPTSFSDRKSTERQRNTTLQPSIKRDRSMKQEHKNLSNSHRHKGSINMTLLKSGRSINNMNNKSNTKYSLSSRMNSSTSRADKTENSTKATLMMTQLENATLHLQRQKENKKLHEQGKNCRLVIIQGTSEEEHFVPVDKIGDIMKYLSKEQPRYKYYKSIPSQLTIDYFLMEGGREIDGKFLNGQSLYLKPCASDKPMPTINDQDMSEKVGLNSFEIIKNIGSGGFSKVFLCRFKQDGHFYAMKVIDKDVIVKNKKKRIIANERNIMKAAEHSFVIDMKFAFECEKYLIFVMEYCAGGELFGLIKKYRRLEESMARFYIIQIFLGLAYLHQQKVVYRDIKPENILLCQNGHVKIADLGLAKPEMFQGQLAYSFCGSPEYMSPEMILQVGHTYPVDYYCMGALLYELLTGLPPYYSRDPNEIYESVLSQELVFPPDVPITSECKSLLKGLLCKQPKQRLGSLHGVKEILAHPWFGKNQYKKFIDKEVQPPTNFASIGKVNLDNYTDEEKNKKEVEQIKKEQKLEKERTNKRRGNRTKQVMKSFYYDFRQSDESNQHISYSSSKSVMSKQKKYTRNNSKQTTQQSQEKPMKINNPASKRGQLLKRQSQKEHMSGINLSQQKKSRQDSNKHQNSERRGKNESQRTIFRNLANL